MTLMCDTIIEYLTKVIYSSLEIKHRSDISFTLLSSFFVISSHHSGDTIIYICIDEESMVVCISSHDIIYSSFSDHSIDEDDATKSLDHILVAKSYRW